MTNLWLEYRQRISFVILITKLDDTSDFLKQLLRGVDCTNSTVPYRLIYSIHTGLNEQPSVPTINVVLVRDSAEWGNTF